MERRVTKQGKRFCLVASCASLLVLAAHGCTSAKPEAQPPDEIPAQAGAPSVGGCCDGGGAASDPAAPQAGSDGEHPGSSGAAGSDDEQPGSAGAGGAAVSDLESVAGLLGDFGAPWKDSWVLHGCLERHHGRCDVVAFCPIPYVVDFEDMGVHTLQTFPIGGVPGQNYKVTFTFNAVWEGTFYREGARDQVESTPEDPENGEWDGFYRGGNAIPTAMGVLKLSVLDDQGQGARHYYLNSVSALDNEAFPTRRTYLFSYTKSIVVVGGGKVTYLVHAPACNVVDNCGPGINPDEGCESPRFLPNEPEDVTLPTMYLDPRDATLKPTTELNVVNTTLAQPWHAQLGHLTVTAVEATDDPITHDYF